MTPQEKHSLVRAIWPVVERVRRDVSAVKVEDGSSRWTRQSLDPDTLTAHVNGGPARGACPIKEGESVTMLAVIDLDSHKGETPWADMLAAARDLQAALALMGYNAVPWRSSGGRGVHLLLLWDAPQDAHSVRMALRGVLAGCGLRDGAGGVARREVEVYPRQDAIGLGEFGNQFILPLAGASTLLDLDLGLALPRDAVLGFTWPSSHPVPVVERPEAPLLGTSEGVDDIDRLRAALMLIPNDGGPDSPDYFGWRDLGMALHEATAGSADGLALFLEWSAQNPAFDPKFTEDRVWAYFRTGREGGITRATIYAKAREHGWVRETPDGFTDVPGAVAIDFIANDVQWAGVAAENRPENTGVSPAPAAPVADATGFVDVTGGGAVLTAKADMALPPFARRKDGTILPLIDNVLMAVRSPHVVGWHFAYDQFRDEMMVDEHGRGQWRAFRDTDYTRIKVYLERNGFDEIAKEKIRDTIAVAAEDNTFDSAQVWLKSLPSPQAASVEGEGEALIGRPAVGGRCERFLIDYLGCEDTPYVRACGLYLWTALAGRVMDPGCQADMTVVFIGAQGSGKTTAVKLMAPSPDFFTEIGFHESEENLARKMRGRLVGEFGELTGLRRKEVDALKAFLTRTHESWVPKWKEFSTNFPRRLLCVGTTNNERFLVDDTGNRRWLPVRVGVTNKEALKRDVLLLWAEARDLWLAGGVRWEEAERLARAVHSDHEVEDPWTEVVEKWLDSPDMTEGSRVRDRPLVTGEMVLREAVRLDVSRTQRSDQMRAANLLRKLGGVADRGRDQSLGRIRGFRFPSGPTSGDEGLGQEPSF